jgi:hypothetical protein
MGTVATRLAAVAYEAKGAKTLDESVPAHYLEEFGESLRKRILTNYWNTENGTTRSN